jgi:hypothetical protein
MARIETISAVPQPPAPATTSRWRMAHDLYLKAIGLGHLGWALWEWAALMGFVTPLIDPSRINVPRQGAVMFFASLDPVAAVGLWLGSAWGTATWLVVTFARVIIHTGYAGIFGWNAPWTALQAVSVLVYLALFFLAERAEREAKKHRRRPEPS